MPIDTQLSPLYPTPSPQIVYLFLKPHAKMLKKYTPNILTFFQYISFIVCLRLNQHNVIGWNESCDYWLSFLKGLLPTLLHSPSTYFLRQSVTKLRSVLFRWRPQHFVCWYSVVITKKIHWIDGQVTMLPFTFHYIDRP